MRTNRAVQTVPVRTHEGGRAMPHQTPELELERAVATCLLFENTFYEKGAHLAQRIAALCAKVSPEFLSALAIKTRFEYKLRHAPLWLARQMVRLHTGPLVGDTIARVVRRPDEAAELVSLYWTYNTDGPRAGHKMLPKQMKRGLAEAFRKWDAYSLGKWNRDHAIKLRDVLFLAHPSPRLTAAEPADFEATRAVEVLDPKTKQPTHRLRHTAGQGALWTQLIQDTLPIPDTWEVALSAGADKKATWERLLTERTEQGQPKLGVMALLANLRNMTQVGVDLDLVGRTLVERAPGSWALPFRFVAAAKAAPALAQACSDAMLAALQGQPPLTGQTLVVVDVSGSMDETISEKSTLSRWEAAAALAILVREVCPSARVFTFSDALIEIPNMRGLGLLVAIGQSQAHHGTYLAKALDEVQRHAGAAARVVVVTDEQSHDGIASAWAPHSYLLNVAGYQPALDTRAGWTRISGWSERSVEYMRVSEALVG